MNKKVIVTGGMGYIGSHTVVELINKGYEPIIIDNLSNSELSVLDGLETITGKRPVFEELDLRDKLKVNSFFKKHSDAVGVIHFAAYKAVGESVEKPLMYYENNIGSLINVIYAMQESGIPSVIFSSSCTVYGQPEILPVTESAPVQKALSPYGNTKQIAEEILQEVINSSKEFKCIALRYFNPTGAHESGLIGELPRGVPSNLMPFITQTAIGLRKQLTVFGSDYNTPDGSAIRDYIHVSDLAQAHIVALERLILNRNKSNFEIFNIGTGNGFSVFDVIKSFEKMSGQKLNYIVSGRRAGDIEQIWADTTYANEELNWSAQLTLDQMTLSAWKWEQNLKAKKTV